MKTLYVVSSWVSFPESEYGGLHILIAASDEEALDMLIPASSTKRERNMKADCVEAIARADRVPVSADEPSRIVRQFVT